MSNFKSIDELIDWINKADIINQLQGEGASGC